MVKILQQIYMAKISMLLVQKIDIGKSSFTNIYAYYIYFCLYRYNYDEMKYEKN